MSKLLTNYILANTAETLGFSHRKNSGLGLRTPNQNNITFLRRTPNIFASLAEFERDLIKMRTKAGLEAALARGSTNVVA